MLSAIRQHIDSVPVNDVRIFVFEGSRCSIKYADSDNVNPFVTFANGDILQIMAQVDDLLESSSGEIVRPPAVLKQIDETTDTDDEDDDFGF